MENAYLKEQATRLNGGQPIQLMPQHLLDQQAHLQQQQHTKLPPINSAQSRGGTQQN